MQAPAALLAGKYKFKSSLQAGSKALAWMAEDTTSGRQVIVSALAGARVAALKKSVDVRHTNLATLLAIVENPANDQVPGGRKVAAVVVAEHFNGETLHQRLKRGPLEPALAVDWFVNICGAVAAIHAAGGAHGAISPRSLIVAPEGDRPGPILTQLVAPSSGAYCAPERLQGLGPSEADDVWALHAALFTSLACTPPFRGENKNELLLSIAGGRMKKLESLGVTDPVLSEIAETGLTADLKRRRANVPDLVTALQAWSPPANTDWEDDEATLVASGRDFANLAAAVGSGEKPEPVASVPPVALDEDESGGVSSAPTAPPDAPGAEPGGYEDDEEATAIMNKPPSDVAALLHGSAPPTPVQAPPVTTPIAAPAEEVATVPQNAPPTAPQNAQPDPAAAAGAVPTPAPNPAFEPAPAVPSPFDEVPAAAAPPSPFDEVPAAAVPPSPFDAVPAAAAPPSPFDAAPAAAAPPSPFGASAPPPTPAATTGSAPPEAFPPTISAYPPAMSTAPAPPQLNLDDEEIKMRKAGRGPIIVIVAILVIAALAIGIAMYLNNRASRAGKLRSEAPTPTQPALSASPAETQSASAATVATPPASVPAKVTPVKAPMDRGACVAAHFESGTLSGQEDFEFLCKDKDFRGVNSQLHRRLVVAGVGKVTPGMREWSTLQWFELAATGLIRNACCPAGTAKANLPETAEGCPQLESVLQDVTKLPVAESEAEPRAKQYQDAVVCLFAKGIPRPYKYTARPTGHARVQFQSFLKRAAARS